MKPDFNSLFQFLAGKPYDPAEILKCVEKIVYWNAHVLRRKLDKETVVEVCSAYLCDIMEAAKPVHDPTRYAHAHAKRCIYAVFKKEASLDVMPQVASPQETMSTESLEGLSVDPMMEVSQNVDFITPVREARIHPKIKETYCRLVGGLSYEDALSVSVEHNPLGFLVSSALFRKMCYDKGYDLGSRSDEDVTSSLGFTSQEEETLLALMMARVQQKWVVPAYILMGSNFFVAMYSFWGEKLFPTKRNSFRSLFRCVQIYCYLDRAYKTVDHEYANKTCAKKFSMRVRDIRVKYSQAKQILKRYDGYVDFYCNQLVRAGKRFGLVAAKKKSGRSK